MHAADPSFVPNSFDTKEHFCLKWAPNRSMHCDKHATHSIASRLATECVCRSKAAQHVENQLSPCSSGKWWIALLCYPWRVPQLAQGQAQEQFLLHCPSLEQKHGLQNTFFVCCCCLSSLSWVFQVWVTLAANLWCHSKVRLLIRVPKKQPAVARNASSTRQNTCCDSGSGSVLWQQQMMLNCDGKRRGSCGSKSSQLLNVETGLAVYRSATDIDDHSLPVTCNMTTGQVWKVASEVKHSKTKFEESRAWTSMFTRTASFSLLANHSVPETHHKLWTGVPRLRYFLRRCDSRQRLVGQIGNVDQVPAFYDQ